jgi:hypothetical protein
MTQFKKLLGYTVAWLSVPIVLATFIGMNFWAEKLVSATGVKVSPWFTGGEETKIVSHHEYQVVIHRPIFDGLFWEKQEGFVQVDWRPIAGLPGQVVEDVDVTGDGQPDFKIEIDMINLQAKLLSQAPMVMALEGVYRLKDSVAVRVRIQNFAHSR